MKNKKGNSALYVRTLGMEKILEIQRTRFVLSDYVCVIRKGSAGAAIIKGGSCTRRNKTSKYYHKRSAIHACNLEQFGNCM